MILSINDVINNVVYNHIKQSRWYDLTHGFIIYYRYQTVHFLDAWTTSIENKKIIVTYKGDWIDAFMMPWYTLDYYFKRIKNLIIVSLHIYG